MSSIKYVIKSLGYPLYRLFFHLRSLYPVWFLLNRRSRRILRENPPTLSPTALKVVETLIRDGIALCHIDDLFPGEHRLKELLSFTNPRLADASVKTDKSYSRYIFEEVPPLDIPGNPFVRFALSLPVVGIAARYMGMAPVFYYYTLNVTTPVGQGAGPTASQKWHRDPEDTKTLKAFIYLNDVDEGTGPFTYIRGSEHGGKNGHLFPRRPPRGSYPGADEVAERVPPEDIVLCTGRAGTIIFADTSGLHRGGYATRNERIMFSSGFYSESCVWPILYTRPHDLNHTKPYFSPLQEFAIAPPRNVVARAMFARTRRVYK